MSSDKVVKFLSGLPQFVGFKESELESFTFLLSRIKLEKNKVLFEQGTTADSFYIIENGIIQIKLDSLAGRKDTIGRLSRGMLVGEISMLSDKSRAMTVVAETNCNLYRVDKAAFDVLVANMDPVAYKILMNISLYCCDRLRKVNALVLDCIEKPFSENEYKIEKGVENLSIISRVGELLKQFNIGVEN